MRSGGLRSAARAAARRGDWLSAVRHYEALARKGRARAGDRIQLAHALKELGNKEAALQTYAETARLHPLQLDAQRQYGFYLRYIGREVDALDVLARALAIEPQADIRAEIAALRATDAEKLDRHFLQGILGGSDASPRSGAGLVCELLASLPLGRARRAARARDWQSAEAHYRAVIRRAPNRINAHIQLGHALLEQKRADEALACYRRALVPHPRTPDLYLHVGHALKALGREGSAMDAYLTAWNLKPGFTAAFDEIRGLRPEIDMASLRSGGGETRSDNSLSALQSNITGRRRLTPPRGLNQRQKVAFKYLAGSIAYKD